MEKPSDFLGEVQVVLDHTLSTEVEGVLCKVLDTISDEQALYEATLRCDAKLKGLKAKTPSEMLRPQIFKRMEAILG